MKSHRVSHCLLFFLCTYSTALAKDPNPKIEYNPTKILEAHEKLSSRPTKPKICKTIQANPEHDGYLKIGLIGITYIHKVIKGARLSDPNISKTQTFNDDTTSILMEKVAKRGGDIVVLTADNYPFVHETTVRGKPIAWHKEERTVSTYIGSSWDHAGYTITDRITVHVADDWEKIPAVEYGTTSYGTVWRHDPELITWIKERQIRIQKYNELERRYQNNAPSSEFLVPIKLSLDPLEYGYMDKKSGNIVLRGLENAYGFSEGLACIRINGLMGFIDAQGKTAIQPQYSFAADFSEGVGCVSKGQYWFNSKSGYINKEGILVIPLIFDGARRFSEGLAGAGAGDLRTDAHRFGFIDKTGHWVIQPSFLGVGQFSEGLAPVSVGTLKSYKFGFIDYAGKFIIDSKFDRAWEFSEGLARIKINKKFGYIDKTGKIIIAPQFDDATEFKNGLAQVKIGKQEGYVDKTGIVTIKP